MTDKRIKMDCPFCHAQPWEIDLISYSRLYVIKCSRCGAQFRTTSKMEAFSKWNCR